MCETTHPPQGFCEIWEHERWNSGQKRRFSGWFVFFGPVWESASPPTYIWGSFPKKSFFWWEGSPFPSLKTCEWTKNVSLLTAKTTHLTGQLGSPSSALTSWQSLNISRYDWSCPDLRDISSFPKWAAGRRGSSKMPSIPISEDCCHGQHLQACLEHWDDVSILNWNLPTNPLTYSVHSFHKFTKTRPLKRLAPYSYLLQNISKWNFRYC